MDALRVMDAVVAYLRCWRGEQGVAMECRQQRLLVSLTQRNDAAVLLAADGDPRAKRWLDSIVPARWPDGMAASG